MNIPIHSIKQLTILTAPTADFKQRLARTELRRGLVQLGYAGLVVAGELPGPEVTENELRFVLTAAHSADEHHQIAVAADDRMLGTVNITGASAQSLLYGVFDFLERQGAFFGVDGDLYPLELPATLQLPEEGHAWQGKPRFGVRGLLPWPDFLNCISVFNREDFRAYLEAMLRMRFNTLGIHVYGQRDKWAESFLSFEYGGVGHTAYTDTTATDRWGYLPQRTSRFGMSAAQYYDDEVFGSDATRQARNPWEAAELAQALWGEAFAYAEQLGIRTGVGFEPYQLPDEILRACPPELRIEHVHKMPHEAREYRFTRIDPDSRTARYILETRLAQLLDAYPSVTYVYLWEDEFMNWASQRDNVELPVTPFKQAHDFLHRHAPDKRLVLGGWGGVVRNFEHFHRTLPEDVIFTALSDQLGWDPIHEAFGKLGDRERWPIPWIEDDPSMWFPQVHASRFAKDMGLAEQYGCQGILGIHWRHRIIDPVAGYLARRCWASDLQPPDLYSAYARTQAAEERADAFANLLEDIDTNRRLLSTWTGRIRPDGHAEQQEFAGDYSEAFRIELKHTIADEFIAAQATVVEQLGELVESAQSLTERERLGYWRGQVGFLDPYARAWQAGQALHRMIAEQRERKLSGQAAEAETYICDHGIPLWITLLEHTREAVLAFQHTIATRNDLGMLASIHNKFVRIAAFRFQASLLEFLDELPPEAEAARLAAVSPDTGLDASVIVPTRPTRLATGESVVITAIAPGTREVTDIVLRSRAIGNAAWSQAHMKHVGRRTYATTLISPSDTRMGVEYVVQATFTGTPTPVIITAPVQGTYLVTA
jgi:hypothetical protein